MSVGFCLPPPSAGNSTLLKRVEGTRAERPVDAYWLDYDFYNSTAIQIRDVVLPAPPFWGSRQPHQRQRRHRVGQTITWNIPNADSGSAPNPYRQKGSLWIKSRCRLRRESVATPANTRNSSTGGAWIPSNQVCQAVARPTCSS